MSFCPSCNSILQPTEIENKLYLKCRTCGYKEENKNDRSLSKIQD